MPKTVVTDPKKAFDEIWTRHPELQNRFSSSWWFFLFFPKQEKGYGSKQMMFSFGSKAGKLINVRSTWQKGMDITPKKGKIDEFMTFTAGWINDGKQVHEDIVQQPAMAKLSKEDQYLDAWVEQEDGELHGARIEKSDTHEIGIKGHFKGKNGEAKFNIWNSGDTVLENPQIIDIKFSKNARLGGSRYVRWGKFEFEGDFTSPDSTEHLSGIGYFQRVLMNIPMLPWHWIYLVFEDGSFFSSFILYFGFPNFKRKFKFYRKSLERSAFPIMPRSYFYDNGTGKIIKFEKSYIYPVINGNKYPDFLVLSKSHNGDFLKLRLNSYGLSQFLLDSRIIKYMWESKFVYNEYMAKLEGIRGSIDGQIFDSNKYGNGWANVEYTWGMAL